MKFSASSFQSLIQSCRDSALSLLYPTRCHVCAAIIDALADGVACRRCWLEAENSRLDFDYCEKCDVSLPRLQLRAQARRCGECEELAFVQARAAGMYRRTLRESVLRLKVVPHIPLRLRQMLALTFAQLSDAEAIELILPVSLHRARAQERGFNQAEIIAAVLSQTTGLPVAQTALARTRSTSTHRAGMDAQARLKSVAGAFVVRAPRLIENRTLLLVDDVMTTGSTAHEISRLLLASGARRVSVLTIARAATQLA